MERACQWAIREYGGSYLLRDPGGLDAALGAVRQTFDGKPVLKTLEEAASAYWFYICTSHPFLDGNKRVSVVATHLFLNKNGYRLDLSDKEVEEMTLAVASGTMKRPELLAQIRIAPLTEADLEGLDS